MTERIVQFPDMENPEHRAAVEFFNPVSERFGFDQHGKGWKKEFPEHRLIGFSPIIDDKAKKLMVTLQKREFGHVVEGQENISTAARYKGAVIVAYTLGEDKGFPEEGQFSEAGWLGYIMGVGGVDVGGDRKLNSRVIEVREDLRGKVDLGWYLKILQAHKALERGFDSIGVIYDPLRGPNAQLNIAKLGGTIEEYETDMYNGSPYNSRGTDRAIVDWSLTSPLAQLKIEHANKPGGLQRTKDDLRGVKLVTAQAIERNPRVYTEGDEHLLLYQIPGSITQLSPAELRMWRREQRIVFSTLLDTTYQPINEKGERIVDPAFREPEETKGQYRVTDFFSIRDAEQPGGRSNYYLFERKPQALV